jgi:hypothetical protein
LPVKRERALPRGGAFLLLCVVVDPRELSASTPTWIAVGILLALWAGLIGLGQFRWSYVPLGLAALWTILWLWFRTYQPIFEAVALSLIAIVVGGICYFTESYRKEQILAADHGWLSPDDEWTNPTECGQQFAGGKQLKMGNETWIIMAFPQTVIRLFRKPVMRVDFKEGKLVLSADIFDEHGIVIGVIEDVEFTLNRNNYFRKKNPDLSTMAIIDQHNDEVINIKFLNSDAFKIKADLITEDTELK